MNKLNAVFFLFSLTLVSCASHEHVRAGADGVHRVVIRGTDKTEVEEQALGEARSFCDQRDLAPAFVEEKTDYTGSMDEKTHKTIKKVSQAAAIGGGMLGVMGGKRESRVGQGVFGAGVVGSAFQDGDAYTANMKFKCI